MIAVILPSRGLMFSRTAEDILNNLKGISHKIYFAHKMPLPDCFEVPTNEALKNKEITHLWLVEDDMILPPDTLKQMLERDVAVVTVNYPTTKQGNNAVLKIKNQVVYGGTGCTLVKREVFDELKKPYFTDDIAWIPRNYGDHVKFTATRKNKSHGAYGLHDVNFFMNITRLGIPIHDMGFTIGQRKLKALGKAGSNNGAHKIEEWTKLKHEDFFDTVPVEETGSLQEIETPSGNVMAKPDHAKKLIDKGLASLAPRKAFIIDDTEVL